MRVCVCVRSIIVFVLKLGNEKARTGSERVCEKVREYVRESEKGFE
jgi:hypothetical protein